MKRPDRRSIRSKLALGVFVTLLLAGGAQVLVYFGSVELKQPAGYGELQQGPLRLAIPLLLLTALVALAAAFFARRATARRIAELADVTERMVRGELEGIDTVDRSQLSPDAARLASAIDGIARALLQRLATVERLTPEISQAADKVTEAVDLLASANTEHAAVVTETTASVEEMERTAQNAGRNASRIVEAAEKTAEASTKGQKAVDAIDRIVLEIRDDSREISDRSADLLSSVDEIATIIGSVKGIADQSKILAVNASVEAAKAGPYGVGFAVIAQEVESLAQQSRTSALQINSTLGSVRRAIENVVSTANRGRQRAEQGVTLVANTGAAMNDLGAAIRENSGSAIAIANSIKQQTIELAQIASAIEQINVLVVETEPTSGGLEHSLEEMNERVKALLETVDAWQNEKPPRGQLADQGEPSDRSGDDAGGG